MVKIVAISSTLYLNSFERMSVAICVLEYLTSNISLLVHRANQAFGYRSLAWKIMCVVQILEVLV